MLHVDLKKLSRNQHTLLRSLRFDIKPGELVGIIGPNGAGKTTLLNAIAQIYTDYQGNIEWKEHCLKRYSHYERALLVSYLPQFCRVETAYRVDDIVKLGQFCHSAQNEEIVDNALALLGIEHLSKRVITQLSGGEQQLVHLARIIVQNTPLILLDEPNTGLDIDHQAQLMNFLLTQARSGKAVLLSLHDLSLAAQFCDKLLLLNQGEQVAYGAPSQVITPEIIYRLYSENITVLHEKDGTVRVQIRKHLI